MFINFTQVDCTNETLAKLQKLYSDNSFMTYCAELHFWAMEHKEDLIEYEEPYILKAFVGLEESEAINIKRSGKYAFSVDSESKAKKLQKEALKILKANNKKAKSGKGKLRLNIKVLPASNTVKLSVRPAYSVRHPSVEIVMKVFYKRLLDMQEDIKNTDSADSKNLLKDSYRELDKQIKEWESIFKERSVEKLTVARRCGDQYRFSYYNTVEEKRCQVGFGDVIIFYGSPKPTLSTREPSKKRTDTRDNDPNLLYHGEFEGVETYISI